MSKKLIFMSGIVMLLIAIAYGTSLFLTSLRTRSADHSSIENGGAGGGGNRNFCGRDAFEITEITPSDRVISDSDSVAITAVLSNKSSEECDVIVSLAAPTFIVDPDEETLVVLRPGLRSETFVWLLAPQKQGSFQVRMTADLSDSIILNQLVGLTVTDVLGLTPRWAKIISIAGTFLGPTLTLPALVGWYKEWNKNRKKRGSKKKSS